MFFLNGKVLCLRGGREHKTLKISQYSFHSDEGGNYVVNQENGSKNRSGSYKDRAENNKIIKHYADPTLQEKSYVHVFYLSQLPLKLLDDPSAVFYYRANEGSHHISCKKWFTIQPVGCNTLATMLKSMCEGVGIFGKTNHSLRATGATRLFEANMPEKLIQERTGHRSTAALRQYEHTTVQQH